MSKLITAAGSYHIPMQASQLIERIATSSSRKFKLPNGNIIDKDEIVGARDDLNEKQTEWLAAALSRAEWKYTKKQKGEVIVTYDEFLKVRESLLDRVAPVVDYQQIAKKW